MFDHLPYEDYLTVTRTTGGAQDPDTGIALPATETALLTTPCDAQSARRGLYRTADGSSIREADAAIYVPYTADLTLVESEDRVMVETGGVLMTGVVRDVDRWDDKLLVDWL